MMKRIYDGALMCHTSNCCPVVDYDTGKNTVVVHDPSKPENGSFTMTVDEWNMLIRSAKKITDGH